MKEYTQCPDCSGLLIPGEFDPIRVPLADDEGFPILDLDGTPIMTTLKLPAHLCNDPFAMAVFDPTGFAPAMCAHGLPEHPSGFTHPWAVSWIRAKYLDVAKGGVKCPVCRGEPLPEDMLLARNAA